MNQPSLFDRIHDKGSSEWGLAVGVQHDRAPGSFRVETPRKPDTPRYGTVVPIKRYRRTQQLYPRGA